MSEATREKIFHGVLALAQQGVQLHAVKVQAIATAAGLGKGTLYEYFSSKEELLAATMLWCMDREMSALEEQLLREDSFEQQLERAQEFMVTLLLERVSSYRMIAAALTTPQGSEELPPQARQALKLRKDRLTQLIQRMIDTGRAEKQIAEDATDEYCRYVMKSALLSIYAAQSCEGNAGLRQSAAHMQLMLRKALA